LYPVTTFLDEVAKNGGSRLLPLPSLSGARVLRFVETDQFIRFVADATRIVDPGTPALVHSLVALIDMAIQATSRVVDSFISLGIFDKLSKIPIVAKPLLQLITKVPEIARFRPEGSAPPKKVDRAKVLQNFAQQQATFLAHVEIDTAPPDDSTFVCIFCHEPIAADVAGIMWTPPGPPTCPHYCHRMCYRPGECPVCRAGETVFMPIILAGQVLNPDMVRPVAAYLAQQRLAPLLRCLGQLRQLGESIEQPVVRQLVCTFVAVVRATPIKDSIMQFVSRLDAFESFEECVGETKAEVGVAAVLWNYVKEEKVDLGRWSLAMPDVDLMRLPEQFSELFRGMGRRHTSGQGECCRCLGCGRILRTGPGIRHSVFAHGNACATLFLLLTGNSATTAVEIVPNGMFRWAGVLYVTPEGDQNIGLRSGRLLVLCKATQNRLMREFVRGKFTFRKPLAR
jgi:hypothetical protein